MAMGMMMKMAVITIIICTTVMVMMLSIISIFRRGTTKVNCGMLIDFALRRLATTSYCQVQRELFRSSPGFICMRDSANVPFFRHASSSFQSCCLPLVITASGARLNDVNVGGSRMSCWSVSWADAPSSVNGTPSIAFGLVRTCIPENVLCAP